MAEAIRTNKITEASAASLKTPFTDDQNHEPITPKQYVEAAEEYFQHATSLLEASGLDPPGNREKPTKTPSETIKQNLLNQFDTKDIESEWVPAYKQLIIENYDVFSVDKYDVGHTPHFHHRIESTTDQPIYVPQFKIPVGDEKALEEMSTNLTAAHVLIEQPSVHNTPIFMVAKRGGTSAGQKRFVQDFRRRNAGSKDDKYTIRDVRESLTAVGRLQPKIFSKCDFTGAFYHWRKHLLQCRSRTRSSAGLACHKD